MSSAKDRKRRIKQDTKKRNRKLRNQLKSEQPRPIGKPVWVQSAIDQAIDNAFKYIDSNYHPQEVSKKAREWYYWLSYTHLKHLDVKTASIFVPYVRQIIASELSKTKPQIEVATALSNFDQDIATAESNMAAVKPDEPVGLLKIPLSLK